MESSPHGLLGWGKVETFWREIAWRNVAQLYLATGEESRQEERVMARGRRKNYSEERRQAERDRARMNRQRQREREIQRQRERQQNNDMMTESVVLMSLWPRAINILISN